MTTEDSIELEIKVEMPDADNEELNKMATNLLQDLHETGYQAELIKGGTPEAGTKTGEVITWGSVAITVLPAAIPSLFSLVQEWAKRGKGRTVKFKGKGIDFEGSPEDLYKLLDKLEKRKKKK